MRRGEISTVKIEVVLLLAVIGKRLAGNLPSSNTSTVGEYRKKKRIHAGSFLEHIKNFLGTFIGKRNCSDLDADHFGRCSSMSGSRHGQGGTGSSGDLQKFAAIHVRSQHGLLLWFLPTHSNGISVYFAAPYPQSAQHRTGAIRSASQIVRERAGGR
jgi:hypothetical protein